MEEECLWTLSNFYIREVVALLVSFESTLIRPYSTVTGVLLSIMSSNSSEAAFIAHLNFLAPQMNRYLSIAILLFGTIGNLLNCLALSQRTLRSNPCAALFLGSSVANLVALISGATVRLLAGWRADLTETVGWICKIRLYVLYASRTIAPWLITLATVDRWLSSSKSVHLRRMSSLKNTKRSIATITLVSILIYMEMFHCVDANQINAPVKCTAISPICQTVNDLCLIFLIVLIPSGLMLIFGLMTVFNLRKSHVSRIQPITTNTVSNTEGHQNRVRKTDRDLLKMLCIQVILLTLFALPQAIHNAYSTIIRGQSRSALHNAWSSFILNLFFLLTYVCLLYTSPSPRD